MLQATARRVDASLAGAGMQVLAPIVVGNEELSLHHRGAVAEVGVTPGCGCARTGGPQPPRRH